MYTCKLGSKVSSIFKNVCHWLNHCEDAYVNIPLIRALHSFVISFFDSHLPTLHRCFFCNYLVQENIFSIFVSTIKFQ